MTAQQSVEYIDTAADTTDERIAFYERPPSGEMTDAWVTTDTVLSLEAWR